MIRCADWLIDLGPEGGHRGGKSWLRHTEDLAAHPTSHTGRYLRQVLEQHGAALGRLKRLALGLSLVAAATPAAALETLYIEGPLGLQRLSVNLQELSSPEALWSGSSDLAELNRATDGRLGRSLQTLFTTPLPLPVQLGLDNPMARQVEMLVQSLVEPSEQQRPLPVVQAGATLPLLRQAAASGQPLTLLTLLKVLPGQERTFAWTVLAGAQEDFGSDRSA